MLENLLKYLYQHSSSSHLDIYITVAITASVLFISISIIPFQQYTSTNTIGALHYLKNNKSLLFSYIFIAILGLILLILPFCETINLYEYIGLICTIIIFVIIGNSWRTIINLLDPNYYLLPAIRDDIKSEIKKCFSAIEKKELTDIEKISVLKEMMVEALYGGEEIQPDEKHYKVYRKDVQPIFNKLLLLKDLSFQYIRTNQIELFRNTVEHLRDCIYEYIKYRKDFVSSHDDFLIDLSLEIKDIILIANKENNIHYQRIIWQLVKQVSLQTCDLKPTQTDSYNLFAQPYVDMLVENYFVLNQTNRDSAFEISRTLGEISLIFANKGLINSTSLIAQKVYSISLHSNSKNIIEITYITRSHLSEIFKSIIMNGGLDSDFEFVADEMLEIYKNILENCSPIHSPALKDGIFWYDADVTKDTSIAALVRHLLFPMKYKDDRDYDYFQIRAEKIVKELQHQITYAIWKKPNTQISFITQCYQIGIYYLAYLHHQVATDILIYDPIITIPSGIQKQRIEENYNTLLDFYFSAITKLWLGEEIDLHKRDDFIHSFLSLIILDFQWSKIYNSERLSKIKNTLNVFFEKIVRDLENIKIERDVLYALLLIGKILSKELNYEHLGRKIRYLSHLGMRLDSSPYFSIRNRINHIKRPMHTFNQNIFIEIDKKVFNEV